MKPLFYILVRVSSFLNNNKPDILNRRYIISTQDEIISFYDGGGFDQANVDHFLQEWRNHEMFN